MIRLALVIGEMKPQKWESHIYPDKSPPYFPHPRVSKQRVSANALSESYMMFWIKAQKSRSQQETENSVFD